MDLIHSPLEENTTNLQPSDRQHISRAVLEAVCFQVMQSSKNIVRVLSILIWISLETLFKLGRYKNKNKNQVAEIFRAMVADSGCEPKQFLVDGGLCPTCQS